ncbi:hypothetical protein I79_017039 [Cricetulus griseus]|uniref:Uncharacterized protein n=1 Tax=Cricetulus griseus TaxID=10029 RepID=G3I0Z6_CRIGR|nr:hypothetical protein I79_017039 [Cricetulus griseus]
MLLLAYAGNVLPAPPTLLTPPHRHACAQLLASLEGQWGLTIPTPPVRLLLSLCVTPAPSGP